MTINKLLLLILSCIFFLTSCQQEVEPTIKNINAIFETKDFSIEMFYIDQSYRLSFRDDFMTYVSPEETQRKTISFDKAALVNLFVQNQFHGQDTITIATTQLNIYNDTKKVTLDLPDYEDELKALLKQLNLNYVPPQKK
jgi:hypothetical protein